MFLLLPLILNLVPALAGLFSGPKAEAHVAAVTSAVRAITGTDNPEAAAAALAADPSKAADLQVALARIAAESDAADRAADLEDFKASIADVAGARTQTVDLAKMGSPIAWAAPTVSVVVTAGFFAVTAIVAFAPVTADAGRAAMLNQLIGALTLAFGSVISYWLGSSAGSARKTELLNQASVASPTAPTSVLGAVAAGVEQTADDLNGLQLSKAR